MVSSRAIHVELYTIVRIPQSNDEIYGGIPSGYVK